MQPTTFRLGATTKTILAANTANSVGPFAVGSPAYFGQIVRIQSDVDGFCLVSSSAMATISNGFPIKAGVYEYIDVTPGDSISFISASAGNLYTTLASKP